MKRQAFSFFADEEHSIHRQLENILNQTKTDKAKHYRVYLAAIPLHNSSHDLEVVRKFIVHFRPDIVVAINGFIDAGGNSSDPNSEGKNKIDRYIYRQIASLSESRYIEYCYTARFLANRLSA